MRMTPTSNPIKILSTLLLLSIGTISVQAGPNDSVWIQLFNRADTNISNDWDVKITGSELNVDPRRTFRWAVVDQDTVLEVNYSEYTSFGGSFGHAGYKHRPFSYYLLRVEYMVWGSQVSNGPNWALQNNGLMLHSQSMASMTQNQDFPISMEAQLLGPGNNSSGGSFQGRGTAGTMNLCTPGTGFYLAPTGGNARTEHCIPADTNQRAAVGAWQTVSALILGDSVHHYYAGPQGNQLVMTYYRPVYLAGGVSNPPSGVPSNNTPLTEGYVVIQSESHPFRFRTIELLNLEGCMTENDVNYKSYFLKHDEEACGGVSGIRGHSPAAARNAAPMRIINNTIHLGGSDRVTLEVFDMRGNRIGTHTAQAPFQWAAPATGKGLHVIRAITPAGVYSEKMTLL
jgi:hypothetical protein